VPAFWLNLGSKPEVNELFRKDGATMRTELLRFNGAVERDPAIDAWLKEHAGELGAIAHQWFEVMRKCGDEVRELLHDGCPVVRLGDAPFGYVTPKESIHRQNCYRRAIGLASS
jgi:hypothetical protein